MGEEGELYLTLHCHHQNDCTEMGSNESPFNVSLIARAKSQDSVHEQFWKRKDESQSGESN